MTAIEDLASALSSLQADALPQSVHEKLRLHVIDVLGAWIAGAPTAEGEALIAYRGRMRQSGGAETPGLELAVNCALARLSEVDDIHIASMTTPGSIVIPGALTIARTLPQAGPSDVIAATMAGYEAMIRLGFAIDGPQVLYRGIWPTYFAAPFGVAAVAARLMRLDARQTAHALALALTLAAPGVGHHNAATTSRWFAAGEAARSGLTAALAAQSGFTSDLKLLESGFFANVYGITPNAAAFAQATGGEPLLTRVSFKPWCAARQTMAATQALRELMNGGLSRDEMHDIRASVLPPHRKMIDHGVVAGDRASHLTSVQYQMALAAVRPAEMYDVRQSPSVPAAEVAAFMARIRVEADESLLAHYPAAWPARVAVATPAGMVERTVMHVPGDPDRPYGEAQVVHKFRSVVASVLAGDAAESLLQRIRNGFADRDSLIGLIDAVERLCG